MNNAIKTIVIDDNSTVVESLNKHYKNSSYIDIINTFNDGSIALKYIMENQNNFSFIIMDKILPGVDGMILLEELKRNNINKKIVIISDYKDEYFLKKASEYNVIGYLIKPFNMIALDKIIEMMIEERDISLCASIDIMISELLHNLGIPSHIRGYKYIRDGITMLYNDNAISLITKDIYPNIALKYDTTPSRVERAIRHAIEVSWLRGDLGLMEDLFGYSVSCEKSKPTNSEFLLTLADRLKLLNSV